MLKNSNPFLALLNFCPSDSSVTYVSPEDIRSSKMSGGHLEALCDIYFLSKLYKSVAVVYPSSSASSNHFVDNILVSCKNIRYCPVSTASGNLAIVLLSLNRPSFASFCKLYPDLLDSFFVIGCHRNILFHLQLFIYLSYSASNIFFKSYGSIFLHNLDNIVASIRVCIYPRLFFAHLFSAPVRILTDIFSLVYCKQIFITRARQNVTNNPMGNLYHYIFGSKTTYSCSGPFYFFRSSKGDLPLTSKLYKPAVDINKQFITIGSLGDNTFPTAIYGIKSMLIFLDAYSQQNNLSITWNIAGKITPEVISKVSSWSKRLTIHVRFLGYVDSVDDFYSRLDAYVVPVSGGSAMPIKALEAICKLHVPLFVTQYIENSCSAFYGDSNIIACSKLR